MTMCSIKLDKLDILILLGLVFINIILYIIPTIILMLIGISYTYPLFSSLIISGIIFLNILISKGHLSYILMAKMNNQKIDITRIFRIISSVIILFIIIFWLLKTSPFTRDYYCRWTGGDVIYPATHWKCSYDINDLDRIMN
jgi:hypothetical protein